MAEGMTRHCRFCGYEIILWDTIWVVPLPHSNLRYYDWRWWCHHPYAPGPHEPFTVWEELLGNCIPTQRTVAFRFQGNTPASGSTPATQKESESPKSDGGTVQAEQPHQPSEST